MNSLSYPVGGFQDVSSIYIYIIFHSHSDDGHQLIFGHIFHDPRPAGLLVAGHFNGVSKVLRSPSVDLCEALQMLLRMAGLVLANVPWQ